MQLGRTCRGAFGRRVAHGRHPAAKAAPTCPCGATEHAIPHGLFPSSTSKATLSIPARTDQVQRVDHSPWRASRSPLMNTRRLGLAFWAAISAVDQLVVADRLLVEERRRRSCRPRCRAKSLLVVRGGGGGGGQVHLHALHVHHAQAHEHERGEQEEHDVDQRHDLDARSALSVGSLEPSLTGMIWSSVHGHVSPAIRMSAPACSWQCRWQLAAGIFAHSAFRQRRRRAKSSRSWPWCLADSTRVRHG